ncbi:hypothetical protein [Streptomyces pratensis]|uniref:hypothetical protein n=1 Tax=Streptomyces pratensis TaxID=1169025 RepID=UPI003018384F
MTVPAPRNTLLRGALALAVADRRRSLNLLQGRAAPRWAVTAAACWYAVGALATVAAAAGAGLLAARLLPAPDAADAVAARGWLPALLVVAGSALAAGPAQVRRVVHPSDFSALRSLGVTPGQLVLVRLVAPALVQAAALGSAATAFLVCWLDGAAAALATTATWSVVVVGAALQLSLAGVFAQAPARATRLRTPALALCAGVALGVPAASVTTALGARGPLFTTVPRIAGETLAELRPGWWDALLSRGPGPLAAVSCALAAVLAACAWSSLRTACRVRVLRTAEPAADPRVRLRDGRFLRLGQRGGILRLVLAKEARAVLRGTSVATAGLRRTTVGGTLLLGVGIGHALAGGRGLAGVELAVAAGVLVGIVVLTADEAVQVCGLEAERGCMDLLRQSPVPFRALFAGKAAAFALTVLTLSSPAVAGWLLLVGRSPLPLLVTGLAAASVAAVAACAAALVLPPAESAGQSRVTRSPAADVIQSVLTGLLMLPTVLSLPLLAPGPLAVLPAGLTLAVVATGVGLLAARTPPRRARPGAGAPLRGDLP